MAVSWFKKRKNGFLFQTPLKLSRWFVDVQFAIGNSTKEKKFPKGFEIVNTLEKPKKRNIMLTNIGVQTKARRSMLSQNRNSRNSLVDLCEITMSDSKSIEAISRKSVDLNHKMLKKVCKDAISQNFRHSRTKCNINN